MYNESMVQPMRQELVQAGFKELRSATEVDDILSKKSGTTLIAINSVCGCAAGCFRPGMVRSLNSSKKPTQLVTVFAGQDKDAVEKARSYIIGYPPSSPSAALIKDGEVVFMLERRDIEGHSPENIAAVLNAAFDKFC